MKSWSLFWISDNWQYNICSYWQENTNHAILGPLDGKLWHNISIFVFSLWWQQYHWYSMMGVIYDCYVWVSVQYCNITLVPVSSTITSPAQQYSMMDYSVFYSSSNNMMWHLRYHHLTLLDIIGRQKCTPIFQSSWLR